MDELPFFIIGAVCVLLLVLIAWSYYFGQDSFLNDDEQDRV